MQFLTTGSCSAPRPKRFKPSITGDIRDAEAARERASMIATWGPPVYGLVDIRDRIGTRASAPAPAPVPARAIGQRHGAPLRGSSPRTPSRPRTRRRGEAEVLQANMTKGERETYGQHASTADAVEEPRRRLRSTKVRNMRA